jgi:hypothetical protein
VIFSFSNNDKSNARLGSLNADIFTLDNVPPQNSFFSISHLSEEGETLLNVLLEFAKVNL